MQTLTEYRKQAFAGVIENDYEGTVVLSPVQSRPRRRVLYLDNYGGRAMWLKIKKGEVPAHHLRGCLELVQMGYEVALAEPVRDFNPRRPLPHDLRLLRMIWSWLGGEGIVYCGHNVLYWLPLLQSLGAVRCHIVSHLFAREPLDWARGHRGVVALTPAAAEQAKKLAPNAKVVHLGWGVDLNSFPQLRYKPEWLLHCGIAGRDFYTLAKAAADVPHSVRVIAAWLPEGITWSSNVQLFDGGRAFNFEDKKVSFHDLLYTHYAGSAGSLIVTIPDAAENHALGFTNLIEAMAMGQPIILTRTGTLPGEIDIEKEGCGLFVPPDNPSALAEAMRTIKGDRIRSEEMGRNARRLCEVRYNILRYANELHRFFESL